MEGHCVIESSGYDHSLQSRYVYISRVKKLLIAQLLKAQQYSGVDFLLIKDLAQQMFLDMHINTSYTLGGCVRSISLENA
jgi:hypothetical protein